MTCWMEKMEHSLRNYWKVRPTSASALRIVLQILILGWCQSSLAGPPNLAENIALPVSRADFENRIWTLGAVGNSSETKRPQLAMTKIVSGNAGDEIYDHIDACELSKPCRQNVFIAGTGYLKNYSGERNTVEVMTPGQSTRRHIALLSAFVRAEGLTDAFLTIFEPNGIMPQCSLPIKVFGDQFNYGSWRIKAVYWTPRDEYLTWLQASGGDGGWSWGLQTFVAFTPNCMLSRHKSYLVSEAPVDACKRRTPEFDSWFSVSPAGKVNLKKIKKSCLDLSVQATQQIRVDR